MCIARVPDVWVSRRRRGRHGLGVVLLLILVHYLLSLSFLLDLLSLLISAEWLGGGEATLVCVSARGHAFEVTIYQSARVYRVLWGGGFWPSVLPPSLLFLPYPLSLLPLY